MYLLIIDIIEITWPWIIIKIVFLDFSTIILYFCMYQ